MIQNRTLFNSVVRNNLGDLREGIDHQNLDVNMRCEKTGATPLRIAVNKSSIDSVKILLGYKAKPNIGDNSGDTPLHDIALQFKDKTKKNKEVCIEIATLLLEAGADPDIKNKYGETPFFWVKDGLTPDEIRMKTLLEKYRKQPSSVELKPVIKKNSGKTMPDQQITPPVPFAPSHRNTHDSQIQAVVEKPAIHPFKKSYLPQPSFLETITSMFFGEPKRGSEDTSSLIESGQKLKKE